MAKTGDLYKNIDTIENKCAELISQIDDHLCINEGHYFGKTENIQSIKTEAVNDVAAMILKCHRTILDCSSNRQNSLVKKFNIDVLPILDITKAFCENLTKINQPLSGEILNAICNSTVPKSTNIANVNAEPVFKPALKKQVAFNLNVEGDEEVVDERQNVGNVAIFECMHYSPTHWQNQHKRSVDPNLTDSYAYSEKLMIDSQPLVRNDERLNANSTAADNIRAFLFGSSKSKNDGKAAKTKNVIVSVKWKKDFKKKKSPPRREKLRSDKVAFQSENK